MSICGYEVDKDGIATVIIDMPGPVNVMNGDFTESMKQTIGNLAAERDAIGVVIASGKKTFFAGGDVKGMAAAPGAGFNEQITHAIMAGRHLFRSFEKLNLPIVAAINGAALGGGYELTLACNYRIAWDDKSVLIGLPEATLGLLPGGGGVVRMTKKFGIAKALPYLIDGTTMPASEALEAGLLDEVVDRVEDLIPRAKAWILSNKDNPNAALQPWDRPGYQIPGGDLSASAVRGFVNQTAFRLFEETRGLLPNKQLIFDVAVEALKLDLDTALKIESRGLATLIISPISKNLMSANFFQSTEVRRGGARPKDIARFRVSKVGVIGTGDVARTLSRASALAGIDTVILGAKPGDAGQAKASLALAEPDAPVLAGILATDVPSDLSGCEVIVATESADEALLGAVEKSARESVWCALNDAGAEASDPRTELRGRFVRLSVAPTDLQMAVIEVARGDFSSDGAVAKVYDFLRQIRSQPIVTLDTGVAFVERVLIHQLVEALSLVVEGVSPVRVENLSRAIGLREAPLTTIDQIGLARFASLAKRHGHPSVTPRVVALLDRIVAQGRGGRQAGAGFYDYPAAGKVLFRELSARSDDGQSSIADQDVKDRLLFSAVLESIRQVETGVLLSVAEGNIALLRAIGAPMWTGGYIQFVNTYGPQKLLDQCNALAARFGARFESPQILIEKMKTGESFA
ncbi:MAG: hypothetical protein RIR33_429 [Pseudomonadota bacterium]|jgi:3-hydroxyacyl-CoA dehydrogenase/enoyl-CoA hydratase/3-hydroxybutyryl-CoA epimerase